MNLKRLNEMTLQRLAFASMQSIRHRRDKENKTDT